MNVGGIVDTKWFRDCDEIKSVLMAWQGGEWKVVLQQQIYSVVMLIHPVNYPILMQRSEDYPSTANFHESAFYVNYTEDIYVGYRYFETIPGAAERVNYPFGFWTFLYRLRLEDDWCFRRKRCDHGSY